LGYLELASGLLKDYHHENVALGNVCLEQGYTINLCLVQVRYCMISSKQFTYQQDESQRAEVDDKAEGEDHHPCEDAADDPVPPSWRQTFEGVVDDVGGGIGGLGELLVGVVVLPRQLLHLLIAVVRPRGVQGLQERNG
jgi:hypothetical protein